MAIKNKDGSTYKINGPNPLMREQDIWENFNIHNMQFSEDVIQNTNKQTSPKKSKITLGKTITEKEADSKKEVVSIQSKPTPVEQPKEEPKTEINDVEKPTSINEKLANYKKTVMHCMQANAQEKFDDLYNERTVKVSYVGKFNFEAIIIQEDDMQLVFWTHLDKITKHSIVYPMNREKRWWKVTGTKNAPEGFFINCMPSQYHPNFDE